MSICIIQLMTSDGIKGYGYKNVINTNLVYRIGERIESKSQIFWEQIYIVV